MFTILAVASFVIAAVAAMVSLADSSIIARQAAAELARERALARMGFVPQVAAQELRPRPVFQARAGALMQASRARALPLRFAVQPSAAA
ncbi:MAG: hypothetical protein ACK4IS_03420 [Erythrobacter sp.]